MVKITFVRHPLSTQGRKSSLLPLLVVWIFTTSLAQASTDPQISQGGAALVGKTFGEYLLDTRDVNALSPVCQLIALYNLREFWYPQLGNSPLLDRPGYSIAKGVSSFHHFCRGEIARGRYYRERDRDKRQHYAKLVVSEISYVIDHADGRPDDWPYLASMYVERGKAFLLMKNNVSALKDFDQALRLDKSDMLAYQALADFYADAGQKAKALTYVTEGLRYHPEAVSLQRRHQKLGGKLPYPEPYASPKKAEATKRPESISLDQSPVTSHTNASPQPSTDLPSPTPLSAKTKTPTTPTGANQGPTPPPPKSNPYCRFCP